MVQPLAGMLVVDLSRLLPGPYATRELLRLGARVVRLEPPDGDPLREAAPAWEAALNAGKESVFCDLKAEPEVGQALVASADVVVDSFRPGVTERLGLERAERTVWCSITGFGLGGRHEQRVGHDLNYLGWAGALADTAPAPPPVQIADLAAGALTAVAEILAALLERERTGVGRHLVVSMTHGSHRLVVAPARRRPDPAAPHRRHRLLRDLRHRRRPLPHRRRARAALLAAPLRAARPRGVGRPRVRAGAAGARRADRHAPARRMARAVRRRRGLRRPRRDARGGRGGVRARALARPSARRVPRSAA